MLTLCVVAVVVVLAWYAAPRQDGSPADGVLLAIGRRGVEPGAFQKPRAVAVAPDGEFYVVDRSGRVQLFAPDGTLRLQWELPEYDNGQPVGLAIEADGDLLVNDSHYSRILRYRQADLAAAMASIPHDAHGLERVSRAIAPAAMWGTAGTGSGQFTFGRDVVVDAAGAIYAGDYGGLNDRILKFSSTGQLLREWGSLGEAEGQFSRPQGMCIEPGRDGVDHLLVADCSNHRVQRFALDGTFVSAMGRVGRGRGELRYPMAVAVDSAGDIYVCEWGNHRVQKFSPDGESLGFWGGAGREPGRLSMPWDLEIGPDDRLWVVDTGNHRVQVVEWSASDEVPSVFADGDEWSNVDDATEPMGAVDPRSRASLERSAAVLSGQPAPESAAGGAKDPNELRSPARPKRTDGEVE